LEPDCPAQSARHMAERCPLSARVLMKLELTMNQGFFFNYKKSLYFILLFVFKLSLIPIFLFRKFGEVLRKKYFPIFFGKKKLIFLKKKTNIFGI
jgi:hypothetical protein